MSQKGFWDDEVARIKREHEADLQLKREGTAPHVQHSQTSRDAAAAIEPHLSRLKQLIFEYVKSCGPAGATCDDAEVALGLAHQTCSARFRELKQVQLIVQAGRRPTRSGRAADVWVARGIEQN